MQAQCFHLLSGAVGVSLILMLSLLLARTSTRRPVRTQRRSGSLRRLTFVDQIFLLRVAFQFDGLEARACHQLGHATGSERSHSDEFEEAGINL